MGSASPSSGASQNKAINTSAIATTSTATAARNSASGQVITSASSLVLTCGEVRRVTNATRTGFLRLSEPRPAVKSFGSLMGFGLPCVQAAVLANAPEVNADEQNRRQWQNHA